LKHGNYSPDLPKFLFGYSYGGLLGARLLEEKPDFFRAAILNVPYFGDNPPADEERIKKAE